MKESFYIKKLKIDGLLKSKGVALDLGCGEGRDAKILARIGYNVIAVDKNKDILEKKKSNKKIRTINQNIEDVDILKKKYSIVIANNSLPFIEDKKEVKRIIKDIVNSLSKKGIFYFTLFGKKDGWAKRKDMSFLRQEK